MAAPLRPATPRPLDPPPNFHPVVVEVLSGDAPSGAGGAPDAARSPQLAQHGGRLRWSVAQRKLRRDRDQDEGRIGEAVCSISLIWIARASVH